MANKKQKGRRYLFSKKIRLLTFFLFALFGLSKMQSVFSSLSHDLFSCILDYCDLSSFFQLSRTSCILRHFLQKNRFLTQKVTKKLKLLCSSEIWNEMEKECQDSKECVVSGSSVLWALLDHPSWQPNDIDLFIRADPKLIMAEYKDQPMFQTEKEQDSILQKIRCGSVKYSTIVDYIWGFDFDFLKNYWTPRHLVILQLDSLLSQSSTHHKLYNAEYKNYLIRRMGGIGLQGDLYWFLQREEKYKKRGFSILSREEWMRSRVETVGYHSYWKTSIPSPPQQKRKRSK